MRRISCYEYSKAAEAFWPFSIDRNLEKDLVLGYIHLKFELKKAGATVLHFLLDSD